MAVMEVGVITGDTTVLFSEQIMKYSEQRIPTLNEYCVVCDEQHVFQNGSMLKVPETRERNMQYRFVKHSILVKKKKREKLEKFPSLLAM